jgi:hypothetical protein
MRDIVVLEGREYHSHQFVGRRLGVDRKNRVGLGRKRHLAKADQDEAALVFRFGGGRTSYPRVRSPIICK